jgi:hypothetical protein
MKLKDTTETTADHPPSTRTDANLYSASHEEGSSSTIPLLDPGKAHTGHPQNDDNPREKKNKVVLHVQTF